MDADSLLENDALTRIVRPFVEDATTIAAGGVIRIVNGCTVKEGAVVDVRLPRELLPRFQVLEYLRAFLAGRMGWHELRATLIISGAFGVFKRELVVEVGGYSTDTVGEDMELVVRLHRHCLEHSIPYSIGFVPDPVSWTECPVNTRVLGRQRDRWQRGLMETLFKHRRMQLNPKYGRVGMLAFPYFVFLEMLSPVVEVFGYLGFLVALEELGFRRYPARKNLYVLIWLAVAENFGYRQMTAIWRLKGVFSYLRKAKGWGGMERRGFGTTGLPRA